MHLYMVLLGCVPEGRLTEQHDVFFTISSCLAAAKQAMIDSWPEAKGKIHLDGYQKITRVENYKVSIVPRSSITHQQEEKLFFVNLGGYTPGVFDEQHYKLLTVARTSSGARNLSKRNSFFKNNSFKGAESHVDDLHGLDIDDLYNVFDLLSAHQKENWAISLTPAGPEDRETPMNVGYITMKKLNDNFIEIE